MRERCEGKGIGTPIKAKDSPWDADLMGSVASTVDTKIRICWFFGAPFRMIFRISKKLLPVFKLMK